MTRTHIRSVDAPFKWKLKIFPPGLEIKELIKTLRSRRPWQKRPNGWRYTSHVVSRIYGKVYLPHFHKPIFKLLKNKRKNYV